MYLTKAFVISVAMILVFLLAAFATEQTRCVERARRIFQEEFVPAMPVGADYISEQPEESPSCTSPARPSTGWG